MLNRMNLSETHPGENLGYLCTLKGIGSSLNNNKHIEATLFMVAKALLCKIKLLFEKKQWVKNDLSVSSPLQQYRCWPRHSLCSGRVRGPLLSQRLRLKVSMDLWTYPMIIPWAMSCEVGGGRGDFYTRQREKQTE